MKSTFTISEDGKAITCHRCGKTSHHPMDVQHWYCGYCHKYHQAPVKRSECPVCGYVLDDATSMSAVTKRGSSRTPVPGDLSLCAKCGEILVFNSELALEVPTLDDLMDIEPDEEKAMLIVQKKIRAERPLEGL